jgi:hypothetical protein
MLAPWSAVAPLPDVLALPQHLALQPRVTKLPLRRRQLARVLWQAAVQVQGCWALGARRQRRLWAAEAQRALALLLRAADYQLQGRRHVEGDALLGPRWAQLMWQRRSDGWLAAVVGP